MRGPPTVVRWQELVRHQMGAAAATAVDFGTMITLVSVVSMRPYLATAVGAALGALTNFTLARRWIFRDAEGRVLSQAARYGAVALASLVLNSAGVYLLHDGGGLPYVLARVVTSGIVSLGFNFPAHRAFVFASEARPR